MRHPSTLSIHEFSYELPESRIAKYPLAERDSSKLLVYKSGQISEYTYRNLSEQLPANSLLIFNNTRVIEARLIFKKPSGGLIEVFCLEPDSRYADITLAMQQKEKVYWKCLVGGAKKWKEGSIICSIDYNNTTIVIEAKKIEQFNDYFILEMSWNLPAINFAELLHIAGSIPLPPYLNRDTEQSDKERYQTIYAKHDGSVAAPTAGLHFTNQIFDSFQQKNIATTNVTLHVGAGTFKPVKAVTMNDHEMHAEFIEVDMETIQRIINKLDDNIIAVGTTSLRTIESLYWLGIKTLQNPLIEADKLTVHQWDPYEQPLNSISAKDALTGLQTWMQQNNLSKLVTKTQVIIAPGYSFKIINGLVTNFHQPQSTLLLLVAALVSDDWKKIYQYALDHAFRFLSYGDGSLILNNRDFQGKSSTFS
jgi:S-adenosylmethionine:tRNA ribosyltransferase-isomerase